MNDQPQRMLRIFFNGGYSDSVIGPDFSLEKFVAKMHEDGYVIIANGEGYFPASEVKAMFIFRAANLPQASGNPNVITFPMKPTT